MISSNLWWLRYDMKKMTNGVCLEGRCFKLIVYTVTEIAEYLCLYLQMC